MSSGTTCIMCDKGTIYRFFLFDCIVYYGPQCLKIINHWELKSFKGISRLYSNKWSSGKWWTGGAILKTSTVFISGTLLRRDSRI